MTCIGECAPTIAVEPVPLVVEASKPLYADPWIILFCALIAMVCCTYAAAKLGASNGDDEP